MRGARERAFTTIELMVTVAIVGLTLAASWGSIQSLIRQNRLTGAVNQITTHLRLAREKAVAEGNNYIVTFRLGTNDYQVWDDEGNDAIVGPQDRRTTHEMPFGTRIVNASFFATNRIIFRADGTGNASGSVEIDNGENARAINVLASTGKVTVTTP